MQLLDQGLRCVGLVRGDSANGLITRVAEPKSMPPKYKAFICKYEESVSRQMNKLYKGEKLCQKLY